MSDPARPGSEMEREIAEQPAVVDDLLRAAPEIAAVGEMLARRGPDHVIIAARGTSDHVGVFLKHRIERDLGIPVSLASLSVQTVFGRVPAGERTAWIAISQSGASPDLVAATAAAREAGALTVTLTNTVDSPLARAGEVVVDVRAGREVAVAATKSYVAELLAAHLLVSAWAGLPAHTHGLATLVEHAVTVPIDDLVDRLTFADLLVLTGRGPSYPTALEGALKVMETARLPSFGYSAADLLHGPLAILNPIRPVIAFTSTGPEARSIEIAVERARGLGSPVYGIGESVEGVDLGVVVAPGTPADLRPLVDIVPVQRLALALSRARGHDADAPVGLAKATLTT